MLVYNSEQGLASSIVCPEKILTEVLTESCFINVCCDCNLCSSSKCKGPVVGAGPACWRSRELCSWSRVCEGQTGGDEVGRCWR